MIMVIDELLVVSKHYKSKWDIVKKEQLKEANLKRGDLILA